MKSVVVAFVSLVLLGCAAIWAQNVGNRVTNGDKSASTKQTAGAAKTSAAENPAITVAVQRGAKWLASVQGADGGWGQDGGDPSNVRQGAALESKGNDVANTAIAALALLRAGAQYRPNVERAVDFILRKIEASPADGLSVTDVNQTQVQRKLGPYIDTFVASMLLAQVDGTFAKPANLRIRSGLQKCVAKIERNQMKDGSWNVGGGWAPLLGTSMASRSLYAAGQKGVAVNQEVMKLADDYTVKNQTERDSMARAGGGAGSAAGIGPGDGRGIGGVTETVAVSTAAGVALYQDAQALEQLSRTAESREKNAKEIAAINGKLSDSKFVDGYGSIGGEEFFSYLNISEGLKRSGGKAWSEWHSKITQKILKLQNDDGTWAGHHCITGRCAVTSAAILNLTTDSVD
ncbi:MAG TPA: prenyltransferase/squalene oxidase repeat-containing protein [Blastocatellia bacterium]|nr:prenyltransferase/squalene oxidase repeat-containing protein [Blastocatellia bacterium]